MGKINILDDASANMIAAGEVVDRPASALKELIENSIDAGASSVSVYLRAGGNSRVRVCDNGEGIARDDLPKTLLRHATSKIKTGYDIEGVRTLGFRGEALAAAAAVSRMEIISKTASEQSGSRLTANETGVELCETGCPDGTTVTIDDLFYNVPARRKFMKRDATECAACIAVCERLALGNPSVAIAIYSDEEQKFRTPGDGKVYSAVYALYGSAFAKSLIETDYELEGVRVTGYVSRPDAPRASRAMQTFFVNSRYVKSKTIQAALEEAYRSYIPSGKFPAGILYVSLPYSDVDVNVHPAKTEIKFADEKKIFHAVYYAVKNVLSPSESQDTPQAAIPAFTVRETPSSEPRKEGYSSQKAGYEIFSPKNADEELPIITRNSSDTDLFREPTAPAPTVDFSEEISFDRIHIQETFETEKKFKIIGEAWHTYIFAELDDKIIIADKHAAHERIIYEQLKDRKTVSPQTLLFPITVTLSPSECAIIVQNAAYLESFGFSAERLSPSSVAVKTVPSSLRSTDGLTDILEKFAKDISESSELSFEDKVDRALYTVACKSALKAGNYSDPVDAEYIIENILKYDLRYCPHGRPFVREISKRDVEKMFDR